MGSAIWKLSALATVVGLGMVGVVVQQKGLMGPAKPGATAGTEPKSANGAAAPPTPKVPKAKTETASEEFSEGQTPDLSKGPPDQSTEVQSDPLSEDQTDTADQGGASDTIQTAQATPPRTRARGLNFKDRVPNDGQSGTDATDFEGQTANGATPRGADSTNQAVDAAEMEGTVASDNSDSGLTGEDDPFEKHKAAVQGTSAQAQGPGYRPNTNNDQPSEPVGADRSFEQDPGTEPGYGPAVPGMGARGARPRNTPIDDGSFAGSDPGDNVVSDVVDGQSGAAPAGYRAAAAPRGKPLQTAAGGRPKIGEDEGFKNSVQGPPAAPTSAPPPTPRTGSIGTQRPTILQNDDDDDSGLSRPAAPGAVKAAPPKLIDKTLPPDDTPSQTDRAMPPSFSKNGRGRPNSLVEDDGEGLGTTPGRSPSTGPRGTDPRSTGSQSTDPRTDRTETNPRGPVQGSEFDSGLPPVDSPRQRPNPRFDDDNAPLTGTPDAAASRTTVTDVRVSPQQSGGDFPGTAPRTSARGNVMIEKSIPPTAYVGQPLVYIIKVKNLGNGPAQQVVIEDVLPEGVAMQGSTLQAELTGRKLAWKLGTMSAGEERKISVKVVPGKAGTIGSSAKVNYLADQRYASAEGAPDSVQATTQTTSRTTPRTAPRTSPRTGNGIELEMQPPPQIKAGQAFELRFRVVNRSSQPVTNLLVRNMLPGGVMHESRVQDLEYRVGTLAPGESRDMPLTLTASQAGRTSCRAMVMSGDDQVLSSEEFAFDVAGGAVTSAGQARPSLGVEVVPPSGPVQLGGRATYEIRLVNRGSAPVRQGIVRLTVPEELRLVNAGPLSYQQEGSDLVFEPIPSLEAGQQAIVKVEFQAQAAGETYVKVQTVAAHMKRPLSREEGLTITGN